VLIGFGFVVVLLMMWKNSRGSAFLDQWASRCRYRIISREFRYFFKGPFFWTSSNAQVVYYVTIEDGLGRVRSGWVRCGGYFLGLLSDDVEVQWDV
jgi:hypothetical protein